MDEAWREGGREEGMKGGREEGRKGGREGREEEREWKLCTHTLIRVCAYMMMCVYLQRPSL